MNYTNEQLLELAGKFALEGTIASVKPLGEGFINDTFTVKTVEPEAPNYILQRKNKAIFPDVPAMMDNIERVTAHLRKKVLAAGGDVKREVLRVVKTTDGALYYKDAADEYWAVCEFIEGSITYARADSPALAYKGGQGIGRFQSQLADFEGSLAEVIKGFHNMAWRYQQWDEAVAADRAGRVAQVKTEIEWIESRRQEMLEFQQRIDSGELPMRVTHNDTKISNILFDANGEVLCAIDLDTVMSATALNDYGDAIRSYANTADEAEPDLSKVGLSLEMFEAYTKGYLSERASTMTDSEKKWLAFSARFITCEQVLRFLMDYIDGDTYYKITYPEHNLVRARSQYKLLQSMEEHYQEMCDIVAKNC